MPREKDPLAKMSGKIAKLQTEVEESLERLDGSYFSSQGLTALAKLLEVKESTNSLQLAVVKAVEELKGSMQMSTQDNRVDESPDSAEHS